MNLDDEEVKIQIATSVEDMGRLPEQPTTHNKSKSYTIMVMSSNEAKMTGPQIYHII